MKLMVDPMPALRAARIEAVNRNFSAIAAETLHLDLVALMTGDTGELAAREAQRQKLMRAIERATTPAELDDIKGVL